MKGDVKEGLELTLMGSFDVRQGGGSTLDLIVTEFWMGCQQMDLASACVLHPLNRMVLDFKTGGDGMNEQRSGVYRTGVGEGGYSEGKS